MPPRWLRIAIVAFWLGTTGWLVYQDVWLPMRPGQALPYTIDLEDEVKTRQDHVRWSVLYNDRPYLRAETWVEPNAADDTFTLISELHPLIHTKESGEAPAPFSGLVEIVRGTSSYHVTRQGDLRSVSIQLSALFGHIQGDGLLTGEVRDGRFRPHLKASSPDLPKLNFDDDLDPVPMPAHGSILSPMHPVNRIAGLRPGQTWTLPLVDPVRTVVSALTKKYLGDFAPGTDDEEVVVTARVRPQREMWTWNNRPVECFVIDYHDQSGETTAQTWVRGDDGLVLRQEAEHNGERWALQRE